MATSVSSQAIARKLVVIGLGLIGGSLAKAAVQRKVCEKVIGVVRRTETGERAVELGIVHEAYTNLADIAETLREGDVIFIAVPTLSVKNILRDVARLISPAVTVTDGASVKGSVLADAREIYGQVPPQLVLGHPIAGSEKSGVEAANADLYIQHRIILTPTDETGPAHLQRVTTLWESVGGEVLHLGVEDHDEVLAATSHLPHAIAFSLVDTLAHDSNNENIFRYAAGGFRDFTRIASSDAVMWRDIMLANDRAVLQALDLFGDNLARLKSAIEQRDEQQLLGIFTRAKAARDHFSAMLAKRAYVQKDGLSAVHYRFHPSERIEGIVIAPADKSLSHRAVMLASLAEGRSQIDGFIEGEDAFATLQAFRDMGVVIDGPHDGRIIVHGVGLHGLQAPAGAIYVGNATTSLRLLCGILAAQAFDSEISTGRLLNSVSLESVVVPLVQMGADIATEDGFAPPISIHGGRELTAIEYDVPVPSAQVKSALLLAGLYSAGETRIRESVPTRDHTERLLKKFGGKVLSREEWLVLPEGQALTGCDIRIPGDFSSSLVLVAMAGLVKQANLLIQYVGINPSRTASLAILQRFGMQIQVIPGAEDDVEPVGDIRITTSAKLAPICADKTEVSSLMEELPIVVAVAACIDGETHIHGYRELNMHQHSRLQKTLQGLRRLGVSVRIDDDTLTVCGGVIDGGEVDAGNDHRVALAFAVLSARTRSPLTVRNCATIEAAFPHFSATAKRSAISIEVIDY